VTRAGRLIVGPGALELIRQVGPTAWAVLELAVARGDGRVSAVSARRVAAELGVAKDTAARALRALTGAGLLDPMPRRRSGGRFEPGGYRLHVPVDVLAPDADRAETTPRRTRSRPQTMQQLALLEPD
jgi:hypothetical protein